jgi:hypothetical protein
MPGDTAASDSDRVLCSLAAWLPPDHGAGVHTTFALASGGGILQRMAVVYGSAEITADLEDCPDAYRQKRLVFILTWHWVFYLGPAKIDKGQGCELS